MIRKELELELFQKVKDCENYWLGGYNNSEIAELRRHKKEIDEKLGDYENSVSSFLYEITRFIENYKEN